MSRRDREKLADVEAALEDARGELRRRDEKVDKLRAEIAELEERFSEWDAAVIVLMRMPPLAALGGKR